MDEATRAFFRQQLQDPDNQSCMDCGTTSPQWASVSHGCYISLESSGVHRSLGVHISFVRSTTMDSWKPNQLKRMELGGNRKLKEFFRQHGIPDDTPIAQKYSTRAAEWYRRNLQALVEGGEPPPPLPEGTGHLPISDTPSSTQLAFAKAAAAGGMMSAGGAFASDARHYGGYHNAGAPERGKDPSPRRPMDGFSSEGPARAPRGDTQDDFLGGLLGPDVGSKVSTGVWSAVGFVGSLASKAKTIAENKVSQAQSEGWLDTALETAKQGVGAAVETTSWAAQRGVEAGKATYTYVNEGGGSQVLGKTSEVLGSTAKKSMNLMGSGVDWFSEQIGGLTQDQTATGLQNMSSGKMQGFGSDCPPPSPGAVRDAPAASASSQLPYHLAPGPELTPRKAPTFAGPSATLPTATAAAAGTAASAAASAPQVAVPAAGLAPVQAGPSPAQTASPAKAAQTTSPAKAASVWNDDDWGDWS